MKAKFLIIIQIHSFYTDAYNFAESADDLGANLSLNVLIKMV